MMEPRSWSSQPPATFTTLITEGHVLKSRYLWKPRIQGKALERIDQKAAISINCRSYGDLYRRITAFTRHTWKSIVSNLFTSRQQFLTSRHRLRTKALLSNSEMRACLEK